jgi:hypothetical protein
VGAAGGLVERGVAHNIFAGLSTNGQVRSRRIEELAPHFRGFTCRSASTATGRCTSTCAAAGSWTRLVENLEYFQSLPAPVSVAITPTLQNTNALDMVQLIGFLEDRDLQIAYNAVDFPARLRPDNLPRPIKLRAAARLREYMALSCLPKNAGVIRAYCEPRGRRAAFDEARFAEYLTFTAELDAARDESLADGGARAGRRARRRGRRVSGPSGTATRTTRGRWIDGHRLELDGVEFVVTADLDHYMSEASSGERFVVAKHPAMIDVLSDVVEELQPRRIAELGIFKGGSTALLALLTRPER